MAVEDEWLLDPTLDQANKQEWPRSIHVGPLAIRLSEEFWAEYGSILVRTNKLQRAVLSAPAASGVCQCRRRPAITLETAR